MLLKNAKFSDGTVGNIAVKDGVICETCNDGYFIDLDGMLVLPGFIDTHMHGAMGEEAGEYGSDLEKISVYEGSKGVTAFVPTVRCMSPDDMIKSAEHVSTAKCSGAKIAGVHLEGPFISQKFPGVLSSDFIISPDLSILEKFISSGIVKIITVAPELPGIGPLIEKAVENGIVVSMGHSGATYDEALNAVKKGASQATHLFNAMSPLHHREPGIAGASLLNTVKCELVCDFVHLSPEIIKMIYMLKSDDGINLISDSCAAAGMPEGTYIIDGKKHIVDSSAVRLENGTIAGSRMTMHEGFKNLISIGIPVESASKMASLNPAKTLGIDNKTGSIETGKLADLVVLDDDLNIKYTFVEGNCIYQNLL